MITEAFKRIVYAYRLLLRPQDCFNHSVPPIEADTTPTPRAKYQGPERDVLAMQQDRSAFEKDFQSAAHRVLAEMTPDERARVASTAPKFARVIEH